jgi:hypothetical protein
MSVRSLMPGLILGVLIVMAGCSGGDKNPTGSSIPTINGSGSVITEERPTADFSGIKLVAVGSLNIEIGDTCKLEIEAEDNLTPYIETEVQNGVLKISTGDSVRLQPTKPIIYTLTTKDLKSINHQGSGCLKVEEVSVKSFSATLAGTGDIEITSLQAESFKAVVSGTGDLLVYGGEVEEQEITLSGTGDFWARDMVCDTATVHSSGTGCVTVHVNSYLCVYINSTGCVYYIGDPSLYQELYGTGKVVKVG